MNEYDENETFNRDWHLDQRNAYFAREQTRYYRKLKSSVAAVALSQAEEPLPILQDLPEGTPYPVEALGPVLGKAVTSIANKIQVPTAMAAQSVLAAATLTVQAFGDLLTPYCQTRPISLFFVSIASSGDRKTSADAEALKGIRQFEEAQWQLYELALPAWRLNVDVWESEQVKIKANRKMDATSRAEALQKNGPRPEPPLSPNLLMSDATIEGLFRFWVNGRASLGLMTSEAGQFVGGHSFSAESKLRSSAAYSDLWDGTPVRRARAGEGELFLNGRRLAINLMIQPKAAYEFFRDPVLRDQGLLSRFLIAFPTSLSGHRPFKKTDPIDQKNIDEFSARIRDILDRQIPLRSGRRNELEPRKLSLSEEAQTVFEAFLNQVESHLSLKGRFRPIRDVANKSPEMAARLACVIGLFEDIELREISADLMHRAVALMRWYLEEVLRISESEITDSVLEDSEILLSWLHDQNSDQITKRHLLRFGPNRLRQLKRLIPCIEKLIDHGWLVRSPDNRDAFQIIRAKASTLRQCDVCDITSE